MHPFEFIHHAFTHKLPFCLDDDTFLNNSISQRTGDISLKIKRVQVLSKAHINTHHDYDLKSLPTNEKIHERSKKALAHRVGCALCLQLSRSQSHTILYRTALALKSVGVIQAIEQYPSVQL